MKTEIQVTTEVSQGIQTSVFFIEISPNFNLKNMMSTIAKDVSWEKKWPKFARFQRKTKNPNHQIFVIRCSSR